MADSPSSTTEGDGNVEEAASAAASVSSTPSSTGTARNLRVPRPPRLPLSRRSDAEDDTGKPSALTEVDSDDEDGYQSDDGPNFEAIESEGIQDFDEDDVELPVGAVGEAPSDEDEAAEGSSVVGSFVGIAEEVLKKLTVKQLKTELRIRGKSEAGLKPQLQARLRAELSARAVVTIDPSSVEGSQNAQPKELSGFPHTAYWEVLEPDTVPVEEPENSFAARAPTIPADECDVVRVPEKYNYSQQFDRPPFTGVVTQPILNVSNGKPRLLSSGRMVFRDANRDKGAPNPKFIKQHGLNTSSHPIDWFEAYMPDDLWAEWTTNTNRKAYLSNAGNPGQPYPDFKPFSILELRQFVGLYMIHGLAPSPRVEMKMRSQSVDPVNGNDLVWTSLPPNAERRLKHFKKFFSIQDPVRAAPPRKQKPNWKVDPFIKHINETAQASWLLGKVASGDEQTMGFQGRCSDKKRINFKNEGDGFQNDAICDNGFTYAVYFRNEPAPQKYLKQGLSPLHARVMALFDALPDKRHRVYFDNLYMSAKFARAAYNHPKQVFVAGVVRKGGRGLPPAIFQEEVKNPKEVQQVRGTVKVAVLKGDPGCPDLIAASVYDTKPVHFMSMAAELIQWVRKQRLVFNPDTGSMETMRFLRLNINNDYNFGMGGVDIADQLRNYYRMDHWLRMTKWWWSIFLWGMGVQMVNAYILYVEHCTIYGLDKKEILSQFEFRKKIALAMIAPTKYHPRYANNDSPVAAAAFSTDYKRKRKSPPSSADSDGQRQTRLQAAAALSFGPTKAPRVNDQSLAVGGALEHRLNCTNLRHLPTAPTGKKIKCQLHRWASEDRIEICAKVLCCSDCRVNLCIECYSKFHTEQYLLQQKATLKARFLGEKEAKKAKRGLIDDGDSGTGHTYSGIDNPFQYATQYEV